jgi:Fe-S cluster assembly protein SufD
MSKQIEAPELTQKFSRLFQQYESVLNGKRDGAIHRRRQAAMEALRQNRFPSTKVEEWRYTNVARLLKHPYDQIIDPARNGSLDAATLDELALPRLEALRLVFFNGHFIPRLSDHQSLPEGLRFEALTALDALRPVAEAHFACYAGYEHPSESFVALNTALGADGAVIHVARNQAIERPIHLINVTDGRSGSMLAQPRHLIVLEEGAEARFIEQNRVLAGEQAALTNVTTEVVVNANAKAEYYHVQDDPAANAHYIGTLQAHQARDAQFYNFVVTTGNAFTRNNHQIRAAGENGESHLYGLYAIDGLQLADNHTLMDHAVPHCYSNEFYRGVLNNRSHGVFNGRVLVRPHAQKTDAYQNSGNVLLTDSATLNAKPQLEIFADDVSCSHGATSGNLDESSLFYMRARGIPEEQARRMLTFAFASEVLRYCRLTALQEHLTHVIAAKLDYQLQ